MGLIMSSSHKLWAFGVASHWCRLGINGTPSWLKMNISLHGAMLSVVASSNFTFFVIVWFYLQITLALRCFKSATKKMIPPFTSLVTSYQAWCWACCWMFDSCQLKSQVGPKAYLGFGYPYSSFGSTLENLGEGCCIRYGSCPRGWYWLWGW
jgi:hypothetical protein